MARLTSFKMHAQDEEVVLLLEGDDGLTASFVAAPEQIENLIDALDELLGDDDADDGHLYQKPLG